jgi:hypothetical protein
MDAVLSFLISTGIIVFGGLIVAYTITVGAPMVWNVHGVVSPHCRIAQPV